MKKIREIFSGNEGFTLIELLIVIVIIGVLAAIAVPNLAGLDEGANEAAVKANARTLLIEIEAERTKDSPANIEDLSAYEALNSMDGVTSVTVNDADGGSTTSPSVDNYNITVNYDGGTIYLKEGRISSTS